MCKDDEGQAKKRVQEAFSHVHHTQFASAVVLRYFFFSFFFLMSNDLEGWKREPSALTETDQTIGEMVNIALTLIYQDLMKDFTS